MLTGEVMIKTSVALCTFNGEKYIEQLLESLLKQTLKPDEIVICDDCSTDRTVEMIYNFFSNNQLNYTLVINQNNIGFFNNFKKAVSLCTGDIVFLCDQDDVWEETKIACLIDIMSSNSHILSLTTNIRLIDEQGQYILPNRKDGDNPFFKKSHFEVDQKNNDLYKVSLRTVLCHNIAPGCSQVVRKSIIKDIMKFERSAHDWVFNQIAAFRDGAYYYDKPLTRYRYHKHQTIGIPNYYYCMITNKKWDRLLSYYKEIAQFLYILFTNRKKKIVYRSWARNPYLMNYRKTCNLSKENEHQYEEWEEMAKNWEKLYIELDSENRFAAYLKQGRINRLFACKYAHFELLCLRLQDILAFMQKTKSE